MNARELLRCAREEQRSSASQAAQNSSRQGNDNACSGKEFTESAPISVLESDRALWDEEALLVRRWTVSN